MLPKPKEWDDFYAKMLRKSGLDLHQYKAGQLQRRIISMAENKGAKTLDEFWSMLDKQPDGITWFQDRLAINVSELFRNPEKYDELEKVLIPDLLSRNKSLSIWSAGCSYGAEAHSLAAILAENFPGRHTILGSDIDQACLTQARSGVFSDSDMRGVPQRYKKYFTRVKPNEWEASAEIKKYLKFQTGNLLADRFGTGYDLICCRNVVIYFTEEAKAELYQRFYKALRPGGILFVGSTERIFRSESIGYSTKLPFFYQKPLEESRAWQNAS